MQNFWSVPRKFFKKSGAALPPFFLPGKKERQIVLCERTLQIFVYTKMCLGIAGKKLD